MSFYSSPLSTTAQIPSPTLAAKVVAWDHLAAHDLTECLHDPVIAFLKFETFVNLDGWPRRMDEFPVIVKDL